MPPTIQEPVDGQPVKVWARDIVDQVRPVLDLRGSGSAKVSRAGGSVNIYTPPPGLSHSKIYGGIIEKNNFDRTLTIGKDRVVFGSNSSSCEDTVVAVGGTISAPHFIFAYGTLDPLTIVISPISTPTFPVHAVNQWRRALWEVYIDSNGLIAEPVAVHLGVIDLTHNLAQ